MSRTDKYQAAGHATMAKRGAHVGATDAVRDALKAGPASKQELCRRTGLPFSVVRAVINTLSGHMGGVVSNRGIYSLYAPPEPIAANDFSMAVPCRGREFKPLDRNPFAHRDLCMTVKR